MHSGLDIKKGFIEYLIVDTPKGQGYCGIATPILREKLALRLRENVHQLIDIGANDNWDLD